MRAMAQPGSGLQPLYEQLCNNYISLRTFRGQLLGFLPLASGAGIFFLLANQGTKAIAQYFSPAGVVGATITLGLFCYELRGIQLSGDLRDKAVALEDLLGGQNGVPGQFSSYPPSKYGVDDLTAGTLVYAAVFSGWCFLAFVSWLHDWAFITSLLVFGLWIAITLVLKSVDAKRSKKQER
jgi:hypothetical protein